MASQILAGNSKYTPSRAARVLELVAEGRSPREVAAILEAEEPGIGFSIHTINNWRISYKEFGLLYEDAWAASAQNLEGEALDIARELIAEGAAHTGTGVKAREVAMNQMKWSAGRRDRRRYGDTAQTVSIVPIQINTTLNLGDGAELGSQTATPYEVAARIEKEGPEANPFTIAAGVEDAEVVDWDPDDEVSGDPADEKPEPSLIQRLTVNKGGRPKKGHHPDPKVTAMKAGKYKAAQARRAAKQMTIDGKPMGEKPNGIDDPDI